MKKKVAIMLSIALCVTAVPIQPAAAKTKKVKLNKTKLTLVVGKKATLKLKNVSKKTKIKWTTSKKKIAVVTAKGKVTAKKAGEAVITAKVGKKKYRCRVKVKAKTSTKKNTTNQQQTSSTSSKNTINTPVAVTTEMPAATTPDNVINPTVTPVVTSRPDNTDTPSIPEITNTPTSSEIPDVTPAPENTPTVEPTQEPEPTQVPEPTQAPVDDGLKNAIEVTENVSSNVTLDAMTGDTIYTYIKFVPKESGVYQFQTGQIGVVNEETEDEIEEKIEVEFGLYGTFSNTDNNENEENELAYEYCDYNVGENISFQPHAVLEAGTAYYLRFRVEQTYDTSILVQKNTFPQDAAALKTTEATKIAINQPASTYYDENSVIEAGYEGYMTFTPDRDGYYQFQQAVSDYDNITTEFVYPIAVKIYENGTDCLAREHALAVGEINYNDSYAEDEMEYISYECMEKLKADTTYYIALECQSAGEATMSAAKYDVPSFSDTATTNLTLAANESTCIIFTPSQTGYYHFSTANNMTSVLEVEVSIGKNNSIYTSIGEELCLDWVAEYVKFEAGQKYYFYFKSEEAQTLTTLKAEKIEFPVLETGVTKKVNIKFGQNTILSFTPSTDGVYQFTSGENAFVDMDMVIYDSMPDYESVNGEDILDEIGNCFVTSGEPIDWVIGENLNAGQTYYLVLNASEDETYSNQNLNLTFKGYVETEQ